MRRGDTETRRRGEQKQPKAAASNLEPGARSLEPASTRQQILNVLGITLIMVTSALLIFTIAVPMGQTTPEPASAQVEIRPGPARSRTAQRSISKTQIREIYSLNWLKEGRALLLIGQTGVGKTFIAQAAGLHACASGHSVLYMTVTTWLENLALARSSGSYLKYRDRLAKPDLLIFDDFGMRKLSSTEAQDLCEILEERSLGFEKGTCTTLMPLLSRYLSVKSSTLPKPSVATLSVPGFAFASFSKSAQVLNRLLSATKMNEGAWIRTATGMMSSLFQRASGPARSAWLSAMKPPK